MIISSEICSCEPDRSGTVFVWLIAQFNPNSTWGREKAILLLTCAFRFTVVAFSWHSITRFDVKSLQCSLLDLISSVAFVPVKLWQKSTFSRVKKAVCEATHEQFVEKDVLSFLRLHYVTLLTSHSFLADGVHKKHCINNTHLIWKALAQADSPKDRGEDWSGKYLLPQNNQRATGPEALLPRCYFASEVLLSSWEAHFPSQAALFLFGAPVVSLAARPLFYRPP